MAAAGVLQGVKAAGQIIAGVFSYLAARQTNQLMIEQGILAREDYYRQAALTEDEGYRTKQQQVMDFIGAGVEIQGTPLLIMAETEKKAQTEAKYLQSTGDATEKLYRTKGKIAEKEGKAQLISSIFSAFGG